MADFPRCLQGLKGIQCFLKRCRAPPVQQIKINMIGAETLKAAFAGPDHIVIMGMARQYFGNNENLRAFHIAGIAQRRADDVFSAAVGIHLGGIDQADAPVNGMADGGNFAVKPGCTFSHLPCAKTKVGHGFTARQFYRAHETVLTRSLFVTIGGGVRESMYS